MKKLSTKGILYSILSVSAISSTSLTLSHAMEAAEQTMEAAEQRNISLDKFKAESDVFNAMMPNQQKALEDAWGKYGNINVQNRVEFFLELNKLAEKWKDRTGTLRNGKILGQQAKKIKEYINKILEVPGIANDEQEFMEIYGMPKSDFINIYGSIANEFAAKMQILKSKEAIVNWATNENIFKVDKENRKLTHIEASHIYDALINGDFM